MLLVDPDTTGHHSNYLELIASSLIEQGYAVTVCTDLDAANSRQHVTGRDWPTVDFRVPSQRGRYPADIGMVADQLFYWGRCRELIRERGAAGWRGQVFFPYLDRLVHAIGLRGSPVRGSGVSGILMRPQFESRQGVPTLKGRIRQRSLATIFHRAVRENFLSRLYVIDPLTEADIRSAAPGQPDRVVRLVDPADCFRLRSKAEARKLLGLPQEARLILAYGEISARKGVVELLRALAARPGFAQALVVGKGGAGVDQILNQAVGGERRLLEQLMVRIDRRVSDEEERLFFEASDAVWVAYHDHLGMSGVLVRAGQMALPVIGSRGGAIGAYCDQEKVGVSVDPGNIGSIIEWFDRIAADPDSFNRLGQNGYRTFASFTKKQFARQLADTLSPYH